MATKFPPPPQLAKQDPDTQRLNRWLLEIQSILNSDGTVDIGDSPTLTGTPTAPTAPNGTDTTQLATTAFVLNNSGGIPSTTVPLVDATPGLVGTSTEFARADHVHPTDTSRAALASPTFTGTPDAPTAASATNTAQIATTAFVQNAIAAAGTLLGATAYGVFNTAGLVAGANITSVVKTAVGEYTVTFSAPLANINYAVLVGVESTGVTPAALIGSIVTPKTVNGFKLQFVDLPGTSEDPTFGHFVVFGT